MQSHSKAHQSMCGSLLLNFTDAMFRVKRAGYGQQRHSISFELHYSYFQWNCAGDHHNMRIQIGARNVDDSLHLFPSLQPFLTHFDRNRMSWTYLIVHFVGVSFKLIRSFESNRIESNLKWSRALRVAAVAKIDRNSSNASWVCHLCVNFNTFKYLANKRLTLVLFLWFFFWCCFSLSFYHQIKIESSNSMLRRGNFIAQCCADATNGEQKREKESRL